MVARKNSADAKEAGRLRQERQKKIFVGLMAIVLSAAIGIFLVKGNTRPPHDSSNPLDNMAIVDMQKAVPLHRDYARLVELRQQRQMMADSLSETKIAAAWLPQAEPQPFIDAAGQQNDLSVLNQNIALMAQIKQEENKKRAELKPIYEEKRLAIDDYYLNEILNVKLKLENADSMRLTSAGVQALSEQLDSLQEERWQQQKSLSADYEAAINEYVSQLAAAKKAGQQNMEKDNMAAAQAAADRKQKEAQARDENLAKSQYASDATWYRRIAQQRAALAAKDEEIRIFEEHIYKDIAGRAAKLAIIHHLTVILSASSLGMPTTTELFHRQAASMSMQNRLAVNIDLPDYTEELLEAMKE